jgi:hypothetical protein
MSYRLRTSELTCRCNWLMIFAQVSIGEIAGSFNARRLKMYRSLFCCMSDSVTTTSPISLGFWETFADRHASRRVRVAEVVW